MSLLNNMRGTSDETKKHVAGIFATSITGVIAIVWFSTLPSRFGSFVDSPRDQNAVVVEDETPSLSDLFSEAKNQVGSIAESLPDTQKQLEEAKEAFTESSKPKAVRIKTLTKTEDPEVEKEVESLPRIRIAPASGTTVKDRE